MQAAAFLYWRIMCRVTSFAKEIKLIYSEQVTSFTGRARSFAIDIQRMQWIVIILPDHFDSNMDELD
jgi:hypothetical protein